MTRRNDAKGVADDDEAHHDGVSPPLGVRTLTGVSSPRIELLRMQFPLLALGLLQFLLDALDRADDQHAVADAVSEPQLA